MSIYYSKTTKGFYDTDINSMSGIPKDAVEVTDKEYFDIFKALGTGKYRLKDDSNGKPVVEFMVIDSSEGEERNWRNNELCRADIELNKVQDSDPKSVGTVAQWREYRKSLRAWPEHVEFPKQEFRPKAPDAN